MPPSPKPARFFNKVDTASFQCQREHNGDTADGKAGNRVRACTQPSFHEPRETSQETPINAPSPGRRGESRQVRWTRLAGRLLLAALTAMLAAACGSGTPPNPMTLASAQEALITCIPAPDPGTGITRWDSQIGYFGGLYYNHSSGPVTVESVSLLHPRNLIVHGAAVYKMARYKISLPYEWAWGQEGKAHSATQWAAIRQRIPGATIPRENGPIAPADLPKLNPDVYEIAVDMSAASPAGGWAPGVVVTYRAGGTTYTSTLMVGLAIGSADKPMSSACDAATRSVQDYWKAH
jgi:hypothetical protein